MKHILILALIYWCLIGLCTASENRQGGVADNRTCAECHELIFDQWESSMHAGSTAASDELYKKMMEWAMEDTGGKARKMCRRCHYPYASLPGLSEKDLDRPVDCVLCHGLDRADCRPEFSNVFYSAPPVKKSDHHGTEGREHFANNELCLRCHDVLSNPNQVQVCITGMEVRRSEGVDTDCRRCHMREKGAEGLKSHAFLGPHSTGFLKGSLDLSVEVREGNSLAVIIGNTKTPHGYPTGSPLRQVILKVEGFDQKGRCVFANWGSSPFKEAPEALFVRVFEDEAKRSPVPPWRAAAVKKDTRLKPGEVRRIGYTVPPSAVTVKARLMFRLAPVSILERLGIEDAYLGKAHLIEEAECRAR